MTVPYGTCRCLPRFIMFVSPMESVPFLGPFALHTAKANGDEPGGEVEDEGSADEAAAK